MKQQLAQWLESFGFADSEYAYFVAVLALILIVSLLIHLVLHRIICAIVPEFGLRLHQAPSGRDVQLAAARLAPDSGNNPATKHP